MRAAAALLASALCACVYAAHALAPPALPTAEQLAWSDLERGCLIHFNMYAVPP